MRPSGESIANGDLYANTYGKCPTLLVTGIRGVGHLPTCERPSREAVAGQRSEAA